MRGSSAPAHSEEVSARRKKHEEVVLQAVGRIAVAGRREPVARHHLVRLVGVHQLVRAPGVGLVQRRVHLGSQEKRVRFASTPLYRWTGSLNAAELTALIGWPVGDLLLQGVARGGARLLAPPKDALRQAGSKERIVGSSFYPGLSGDVVQRPADALFHTHVIGPTGTGKSTLLANLILSDIRAGRGVVVVDPKADLLSDIIRRIPRELLHLPDGSPRVVVLDPGDRTHPVGFNPLAVPKGVSPELVVDQLVHAFHELYASSWGPRTADVLNASLLTLTRIGSATLVDLPLLLTNASYRRSVTTGLNDPFGLSPFWAWYESLSDDMRIAVIGPVLNKIRAFTMRPDLRAVIGQLDPAWSWLDVPIKKRVVFVSLAKGKLGPELSSLFGSLATSSLWQAMQLRSRIDPSRRSSVMIYLDEFQDYLRLAGDMGDALVQARGLGAAFTVAHQHLGQLGQLRGAVLTNARSRIVLQTTPEDGRQLATTLGGGLTADDLQGLARYEAYASLVVNGAVRPPASIATLPLGAPTGVEDDVHRLSREAFGRTPAEVDRLLHERLSEREGPASVVGRKPRGRA